MGEIFRKQEQAALVNNRRVWGMVEAAEAMEAAVCLIQATLVC